MPQRTIFAGERRLAKAKSLIRRRLEGAFARKSLICGRELRSKAELCAKFRIFPTSIAVPRLADPQNGQLALLEGGFSMGGGVRYGKEYENRGSKLYKGLDGVFLRSRARSIRFFATFEKLRPFTPCSLQKAAPCHGCTEQVLVALVVCVAAAIFFTYRLYRGGNFSSVLRRWSFLCLAVLFLRRSGYFRRVHLFLLGRGVFLRCFPPLYGWMRVAGVLFGATSAKFGAIPCNCFT